MAEKKGVIREKKNIPRPVAERAVFAWTRRQMLHEIFGLQIEWQLSVDRSFLKFGSFQDVSGIPARSFQGTWKRGVEPGT